VILASRSIAAASDRQLCALSADTPRCFTNSVRPIASDSRRNFSAGAAASIACCTLGGAFCAASMKLFWFANISSSSGKNGSAPTQVPISAGGMSIAPWTRNSRNSNETLPVFT
jgi:hypothetical protein